MNNDNNNFDIDTMYESSWNEQENEYWKKKQAEKHIKQARERARERQDYLTNKAYKAFNTISKPSVPEKPQTTKQTYDLPKLSSTQLKRLSRLSFPIPCNRIISKSKETRETSLVIVSHQKHIRISVNLQAEITIHYTGTKPEYKQALNYVTAKKLITDVLK